MYSFEGRVRYSELDTSGFLSLEAVVNYLQDCSTFQSEELGVGIEFLGGSCRAWLLNSWQIQISRYPVLGEKIRICTCPYEIKGLMAYRNFWMVDEQGKYLVKANSIWFFYDTKAGTPVRIPEEVKDIYVTEPRLEMDYAPRKIQTPGNGEAQAPIVVRRRHLDSNHHMNNGQYIRLSKEYLPDDFYVSQVRAEYRKAAVKDDIMIPVVLPCENGYIVILKDEEENVFSVVEFI